MRLHTGAAADAKLAGRPDALAATEGTDIFLGRSAPALDSPAGMLLLAHEAVHVRQQTAAGPAVSREAAEAQADHAAVAASIGAPIPALSAAEGPLYFEAKWHQASLTGAMKNLGFSDQEQQAAYFGNWCRDLSQALVPMASDTIGAQAAFQLVNLLAMSKFGHGVTPAQLGTYDPRQHIDNPAGTTDRDVLPGGVEIKGYGDREPGRRAGRTRARSSRRTSRTPSRSARPACPPTWSPRASYAEEEAILAIDLGRTPEGMMHVGNFSHIVEDLFAHSNWIEIAVGRVVSEHPDLIPPGDTHDDVQKRLDENKPPIENYAADVKRRGRQRAADPLHRHVHGRRRRQRHADLGQGRDPEPAARPRAVQGGRRRRRDVRLRDRGAQEGGGVRRRRQPRRDLHHDRRAGRHQPRQAALGELDSLPGKAREAAGGGFWGDVAEGAAELAPTGPRASAGWPATPGRPASRRRSAPGRTSSAAPSAWPRSPST